LRLSRERHLDQSRSSGLPANRPESATFITFRQSSNTMKHNVGIKYGSK
jgi:hypothetical protein